jgi:hypothetical protein
MCGHHDRARLVQHAVVGEGSGLVQQVYRDRKVLGREWEGVVVQYAEVFSRSYHERVGYYRSIVLHFRSEASGLHT